LQLYFLGIYCQNRKIPNNSIYYRKTVLKCLECNLGKDQKMLMGFHCFATMKNREKSLNAHSENCLFYLQFRKITVYSVCHTSVAFFLIYVAGKI